MSSSLFFTLLLPVTCLAIDVMDQLAIYCTCYDVLTPLTSCYPTYWQCPTLDGVILHDSTGSFYDNFYTSTASDVNLTFVNANVTITSVTTTFSHPWTFIDSRITTYANTVTFYSTRSIVSLKAENSRMYYGVHRDLTIDTSFECIELHCTTLIGTLFATSSSIRFIYLLKVDVNELDLDYLPVSFPHLERFNLGEMSLTYLPSSWSGFSKLEELHIEGTYCPLFDTVTLSNELRLPAEWGSMTTLKRLSVYSIEVSGSIPLEWNSLVQLVTLTFRDTLLEGHLPESWGNTHMSLLHLFLDGNHFTGFLPETWLIGFPSATHIYLDNNKLTGSIANTIRPRASLKLSGNVFNCPLPRWVNSPWVEADYLCTLLDGQCRNSGLIVKTTYGDFCDCSNTGYTGEFCEEDLTHECETSPCANGGTCVDLGPSFVCNCPDANAWTGELCDVPVTNSTLVVETIPVAWGAIVPFAIAVALTAVLYAIALYFSPKDAKTSVVIVACWSIIDLATDVGFALELDGGLFIGSVVSLMLTLLCNSVIMGVLYRMLSNRNDWIVNHAAPSAMVACLGIVQISNVTILGSFLFGNDNFSMDLTKKQLRSIDLADGLRMLLEDFPHIIIQILFMALVGPSSKSMLSLATSLVSVLFGVIFRVILLAMNINKEEDKGVVGQMV